MNITVNKFGSSSRKNTASKNRVNIRKSLILYKFQHLTGSGRGKSRAYIEFRVNRVNGLYVVRSVKILYLEAAKMQGMALSGKDEPEIFSKKNLSITKSCAGILPFKNGSRYFSSGLGNNTQKKPRYASMNIMFIRCMHEDSVMETSEEKKTGLRVNPDFKLEKNAPNVPKLGNGAFWVYKMKEEKKLGVETSKLLIEENNGFFKNMYSHEVIQLHEKYVYQFSGEITDLMHVQASAGMNIEEAGKNILNLVRIEPSITNEAHVSNWLSFMLEDIHNNLLFKEITDLKKFCIKYTSENSQLGVVNAEVAEADLATFLDHDNGADSANIQDKIKKLDFNSNYCRSTFKEELGKINRDQSDVVKAIKSTPGVRSLALKNNPYDGVLEKIKKSTLELRERQSNSGLKPLIKTGAAVGQSEVVKFVIKKGVEMGAGANWGKILVGVGTVAAATAKWAIDNTPSNIAGEKKEKEED